MDRSTVVTDVKNVVEKYFQQFQKKYIILESHSVSKKSYHITVRITDGDTSIYFKNVEYMKKVVENSGGDESLKNKVQ